MTEPLVLALDQGTTSTKAVLVSADGAPVTGHAIPVSRSFPRPGWVEQDASELWSSTVAAVEGLRLSLSSRPVCLALANQRETVVVWDRATGEPVGPCVGWQCQRGAALCDELRALGADALVRELTGLPLDAAFSAPKLRWLLDSDPRVRAAAERGEVRAGTVDSWLVWNLTGGALHVTDVGNASRTLLFDIHELRWSGELLDLFGIPRPCLPDVVPTAGVLSGEAVTLLGLPELPIGALVADSHAALYGHGCTFPGTAKATLGTGTSLMTVTGQSAPTPAHGLAATVAWSRAKPTYAIEGNILSSGATIQWLADLLGLEGGSAGVATLAKGGAHGSVHLIPAFAGLGAPHWDAAARGLIDGLTFATGTADLARAAVDSVAFQINDLVEAVDLHQGTRLVELRVDGGASADDDLVQFLAGLLGRPVVRSASPDVTALGAAYLAGVALGVWSDDREIERLPRRHDRFEPALDGAERELLVAGWRGALDRARSGRGHDVSGGGGPVVSVLGASRP